MTNDERIAALCGHLMGVAAEESAQEFLAQNPAEPTMDEKRVEAIAAQQADLAVKSLAAVLDGPMLYEKRVREIAFEETTKQVRVLIQGLAPHFTADQLAGAVRAAFATLWVNASGALEPGGIEPANAFREALEPKASKPHFVMLAPKVFTPDGGCKGSGEQFCNHCCVWACCDNTNPKRPADKSPQKPPQQPAPCPVCSQTPCRCARWPEEMIDLYNNLTTNSATRGDFQMIANDLELGRQAREKLEAMRAANAVFDGPLTPSEHNKASAAYYTARNAAIAWAEEHKEAGR